MDVHPQRAKKRGTAIRHSALVWTAAVTLVALESASGLAFPSFPNRVGDQYPSATRLVTCGMCHKNFVDFAAFNPYGAAFSRAGGADGPEAAMTAIEGEDSDGDGTSNLDEILTDLGFFPGWSCDNLHEALNAPEDLADFVDPNDIGCSNGTTTTSTTMPGDPTCSTPATSGPNPTASDCLFILRAAVGTSTCSPECICDVNAAGGITATDALLCLKKAVGQDVALNCPCGGATTTTTIGQGATTPPGGDPESGR